MPSVTLSRATRSSMCPRQHATPYVPGQVHERAQDTQRPVRCCVQYQVCAMCSWKSWQGFCSRSFPRDAGSTRLGACTNPCAAPRAVSHEYAQLQKQLAAAHEDQALSAALLAKLTSGGASAPAPADDAPDPKAARRRPELDPLRAQQASIPTTVQPLKAA